MFIRHSDGGLMRAGLFSLLCAQIFGASQAAQANTAPTLEEVIVTAEKKSASIQDTPIAIDAFDEEALAKAGVAGIGDLANTIPSLTIEPFPLSSTTLRLYIRGIGLIDTQLTQDPPVGVYIDGGYIARSSGLATDVADLARVEVLRGPQGTLYGRNATGGAMNLITKRPDPEGFGFSQKFRVGNRGLASSRTRVNLPLWEGAAAKFTYLRSEKDGFIENSGFGSDYGDTDTQGQRIDFSWEMNEDMRVDYAYDRADIVYVNTPYSPAFEPLILPNDNTGNIVVNLINSGAHQFYTYNGFSRPKAIRAQVKQRDSDTDIEGHQISFDWQFSDAHAMKYIYMQRDLFDGTTINLVAGASSEGFRLGGNSIFSFAMPSEEGQTGPVSPTDLSNLLSNPLGFNSPITRTVQYPNGRPELTQEQSSHELQFTGSLFDDQLSYIAGLYFFEESAVEDNLAPHHQLSGPLGSDARGDNTGLRIEVLTQQIPVIDNEAKAIFAQFTFAPNAFDQRLSLTLGMRHSEDTRFASLYRRNTTFIVVPAGPNNLERNDNDLGVLLSDGIIQGAAEKDFADDSFSFTVQYAINDDINVYAKINEAYKSGGFNIREVVSEEGAQRFMDGFDEEKVTAYELGMKADLFANRLRINAAAFEMVFDGQQLNFLVPNTRDTTVANAEEATLSGLEMDLSALLSESLLFTLNYAYLDGEIAPSENPLTGELDDGFVFNSAPRHAYQASLDWTFIQSQYGVAKANINYSFTDERNGGQRKETANFAHDRQDDFGLINARIGGYGIPLFGGQLDVSLWGKNLTDEVYTVNNVNNVPHISRASLFGEPRSYGLDLSFDFGP